MTIEPIDEISFPTSEGDALDLRIGVRFPDRPDVATVVVEVSAWAGGVRFAVDLAPHRAEALAWALVRASERACTDGAT